MVLVRQVKELAVVLLKLGFLSLGSGGILLDLRRILLGSWEIDRLALVLIWNINDFLYVLLEALIWETKVSAKGCGSIHLSIVNDWGSWLKNRVGSLNHIVDIHPLNSSASSESSGE